MLLERGGDVNLPAPHTSDLMMTPYCPSRYKNKLETSGFLLNHGAVYDIFSACFLGDLDRISTRAWVWTACTGNNSQRGDPRYVQALLDPESTRYCASPRRCTMHPRRDSRV